MKCVKRAGLSETPARAVFSVDVEDYFHVEAFARVVDRSSWDAYPRRVEDNTARLLDLLEKQGISATFFVLGWVAERSPGLVRRIAAAGHELACHSYWHRLVYQLDRAEFREDTRRAKDTVEQAGGAPVHGYRAPSYSITENSLWALEVLVELGFRYDSSIFPIRHDTYGIPGAPRAPFRTPTPSGPILEFPLTTFRAGNQNLPVGGGGYLRIFPFWYTRLGIRRAQGQGVPLILYVHPWEIDPGQPRIAAGLKSRFRHYTNLARTNERLERLCSLAAFTSFRDCGLETGCELRELTQ
jgi:polysaccharide deacetylase family protein (PEP-CTERM system associated)